MSAHPDILARMSGVAKVPQIEGRVVLVLNLRSGFSSEIAEDGSHAIGLAR